MQNNKLQVNFFYAVLLGALFITFLIFLPFFKILFLAAVLAIVFYPVHRKMLALFTFKGRDSFSAFVTVLLVLLLILVPFVGLSILVFQEINNVYFDLVANSSQSSLFSFFAQIGQYIDGLLPFDIFSQLSLGNIQSYASQGYQWVFNHFQAFFSSIFNILIGVFIMVLGLFFFLRDGQKFKAILIRLSPLNDDDDESILQKVTQAVGSVIKGSLFIALAQGVLATIGFFIFGIPSAILWGMFTVFAAIIPSVGTAIVMLPAVLFLFFTKNVGGAVGLLIWGVVIVGLVDNILAPIVLKRGIKIHPFLILLSVLGGLTFFGPIGFLAGPIILSLLFALVDIYPKVAELKKPD